MWIRILSAGALIAALASCAAEPLSKVPIKDINPLQALENGNLGDEVRWGGPILSTESKPDETCFHMLSFFLGGNGEPHLQNQPQGHFVACAKGYYDPGLYTRRVMTIVGTVGAPQTVKANKIEHKVATVEVQAMKLWPPPPMVVYYDPWFGPCCAPAPYGPAFPSYGGIYIVR